MESFSIIIPTLNEAENIELLLTHISDVLQTMDVSAEILIVDDGSTDGTRQLIMNYQGNLNVRLISRDYARGLTGAVVAGAKAARFRHIVVMDGDLSHPPEQIPALVNPLFAGKYDMVIGSRYVAGGATPDWPAVRRFGSQIASIPARLLTSTHDPLSGFFAVHTDLVERIDKNLEGFKVGLEVIAGDDTLRILEVPIAFKDRSVGASKMNFTVCKEYLQQLARFSVHSIGQELPILFFLGLIAGILDFSIFAICRSSGWALELAHMTSLFGATHICYFSSMLFPWKRHKRIIYSDYGQFILAVLLAMFVRGGIIAFSGVASSTSSYVLPGIIIATGCIIWIMTILSVRMGVFRLRSVKWSLLGTVLIGYIILLRLIYSGNIELIQEEAYYWNYSQHLAAGYLDHPPMIALLIRFGTILFGNSEFGVRFGPFLCWFITAFFCHRLTKTIFDSTAAFKAIILVAVLPVFFGVGLLSTPDAPLVACWAGAIYYLYRGLVLEESAAWYNGGIWLGLGLCSKYTIALLGPAVLLYMLTNSSARKWFLRPQPYLAALIAFFLFSPVIFWNYANKWASFLFQSQGRIEAAPDFSTHILLFSALILLTPTGLLSAVFSLIQPSAKNQLSNLKQNKKYKKAYFFCFTMTVVPLSIFLLFSLTKEVKLNWTGPLWLAIIPFIAFGMENIRGRMGQLISSMWPATLVLSAILYGGLLHYCAFGLPETSFVRSVFLFGWDDLAKKVDNLVDSAAHPTMVVGMDAYRTASGLGFYRNKSNQNGFRPPILDQTTGRQLFGWNALMYDYWFSPEQAVGYDLIVIADREDKLVPALFKNHYGRLGSIHEISVNKRGKAAGRYFYRMLFSYRLEAEDLDARVSGLTSSPSIKLTQNEI